jgi:hypothetical protein
MDKPMNRIKEVLEEKTNGRNLLKNSFLKFLKNLRSKELSFLD